VKPRVKYQIVLYEPQIVIQCQRMCRFFGVSRSGYYDYIKRSGSSHAHDTALAAIIRKQQDECDKTYGYRRMWKWLRKAKKIHRNPKTILRIMKKYELLSEIRRRRKWRQMGQQLHKYENLLNREFQADRPNHKWVTDISYIHTGQGVLLPLCNSGPVRQ
jgi:putative transposase